MYALPGPKDIDPSGVMAFFYYVFFGMMLSDAGYGLVMVLGTTWALGKLTLKREMAETLRMFRYCGVSTVVWGALFGSWFGDIVQVIGRSFFSVEIGSLALWFEPMADPIRLLLFAFALGIVHLCAGLFVRAGMLIKQRRAWDAVMDTLPVLLLVLGAAPLAAGVFIPVPEGLTGAGKGMAAAGAVLLIFTSGRSGKKALAKLGGGLYGLYNTASGYFERCAELFQAAGAGAGDGQHCRRGKPDGGHAGKPCGQGGGADGGFLCGACGEPGHQPFGRVCTHQPASVSWSCFPSFTRAAAGPLRRLPRPRDIHT